MPSVRVSSLAPEWLRTDEPLRYQMGVSFLCPAHLRHRIEFWFINPLDGDRPVQKEGLVFCRDGSSLERLTLEPTPALGRWSSPLEVTGHWRGWVLDGRVYDAD